MNDNENSKFTSEEEIKMINKFRSKLDKFANDNDLVIADVKGWTESKIRKMALDPEHRCACDPKHRTCPCDKCIDECNTESDHMCLCSVFMKP